MWYTKRTNKTVEQCWSKNSNIQHEQARHNDTILSKARHWGSMMGPAIQWAYETRNIPWRSLLGYRSPPQCVVVCTRSAKGATRGWTLGGVQSLVACASAASCNNMCYSVLHTVSLSHYLCGSKYLNSHGRTERKINVNSDEWYARRTDKIMIQMIRADRVIYKMKKAS